MFNKIMNKKHRSYLHELPDAVGSVVPEEAPQGAHSSHREPVASAVGAGEKHPRTLTFHHPYFHMTY